jgi:DNA-binding HxlR family transcriptional regulator
MVKLMLLRVVTLRYARGSFTKTTIYFNKKRSRYKDHGMTSRYAQYCPVARVLELVGERWTLLVVRELLLGPRRFTDLLSGLPGISTNLLTGRLKELEQTGLVAKRTLPPPAASTVYELTDAAASLAPVLASMAEWGRDLLGRPRPDDDVRSTWLVLGLAVTAKAPGLADDATYELQIDDRDEGETFHIRSHGGHLQPAHGPATSPDAVIRMDSRTLVGLASGDLDVQGSRDAKLITIGGDVDGAQRLIEALVG